MKNIIQHNGVPCVEAKVHMLPTEDGITLNSICVDPTFGLGIIIMKNGVECFYSLHSSGGSITTPWERNLGYRLTNQHLYVTTDEKIKEGDHILMNGNKVTTATKYIAECIKNNTMDSAKNCRKIIATTDPKLTDCINLDKPCIALTDICKKKGCKRLPQPSQSFIEEYCEAGGIDKVLIPFRWGNPEKTIKHYTKDSNNCIIIHPVEELTIEEILHKFKKFLGFDDEIDEVECLI